MNSGRLVFFGVLSLSEFTHFRSFDGNVSDLLPHMLIIDTSVEIWMSWGAAAAFERHKACLGLK